MKTMKKITILMLIICLLTACLPISVFAEDDGQIMLTDLQTKVGETVEIKVVVKKDKGNFGKIKIDMSYDQDMLKFEKGDGTTETQAGQLTCQGDATHETGQRKEFKLTFQALKAGTANIKIVKSEIKNVSGTVLQYKEGSSKITIAEGDATTAVTPTTTLPIATDAVVKVNGVEYKISNEFPQEAVPKGYEPSELEYDLQQYKVVHSEEFGLSLAYLINEENAGAFFMYVELNATFAPYEEIQISDSTKIALLSDVSDVLLPEEYHTKTVLLNGYEFPAWQKENAGDFCVLYAINNYGEKSLYQLDNAEGTYQRFEAPDTQDKVTKNSLLEKLSALLENHLDYVILGGGFGFLLLLLVIIVLSVKLYNRNVELDDIYDEYGLDADDRTEDDVILDIDDGDDDEDEDDAFEYEHEEYGEHEEFEEYGEHEGFEEFEDIDEKIEIPIPEPQSDRTEPMEESLEEALKEVVANKKGQQSEQEDDFDDILDGFSVDFIDLDD